MFNIKFRKLGSTLKLKKSMQENSWVNEITCQNQTKPQLESTPPYDHLVYHAI